RGVLSTVQGSIPVFVGATTLNTRDSIAKGRAFQEMGASGLFLGRPMWCENDDDTLVGFYSDVAAALPDMPIVVYDNPEAFKGKISSRAYGMLAEIPQVIASKYIGVGQAYVADVAATRGRISLLARDDEWFYAWRRRP